MNVLGLIAVGGGAVLGAWLRYLLNLALNPLLPLLPMGTLAANLIAGFLMGIAMETFARQAALSPEMRLLMTTGFLGGLSTFSAFSGEIAALLSDKEYGWAMGLMLAHVVGSVVLTFLGMFVARLWLAE